MSNTEHGRADKITFNKRVRNVMEWILQGYNTKDIIAFCQANYAVDERQGYKYIKAGFKEFVKLSDGDIIEKKALHIQSRWKLFNELEGKKTAMGASVGKTILDSIAKIDGVLIDKIDVTSKGKSIKPVTRVIKATLKIA